ncbi:DegT/DnrJ/EryC1/StrS family aminotransferase [Synergistes jonesii]|uniref:DegT/DnrJ/EryC1/StrS family aminotransferase n=1 Tax=Synergistes jonesii TaxID=2754 RepID=UPI002A74845C|nr:DegT/DnrJ/EryC1/StrS family aminotransferase [Synergistes jonesii]
MELTKITVTRPSMPPYEEFIEEIKDLWESRWLTHTGPKHQELERRLCSYLETPFISLFSNGHMALELAIEAMGLSGEIITTPFTFASTTQAIVRNGIRPVFCDINPENYTIDAEKIEALITEKTSAIIPVHVYGNVCDVDKIDAIAKKHSLKVIYDAAHVFGVKINGRPIAAYGDMSMFSFHATKVFHTVEGGGVAFREEKYRSIFAMLRQFGQSSEEYVPMVGTNAKMTEIHAAMGLCNLRHIDEEIAKRGKAVKAYRELLSNVKGIRISLPRQGIKENYAYFPVVFDGYKYSRDEVFERLRNSNIFARKYFYPTTNTFAAYKDKFRAEETPTAQYIADRVLTLPLYADLKTEDVERICSLILQ